MVLNLNAPSKIKTKAWIKPGKIIRVMTQTTAYAKAKIDYAITRHLRYLIRLDSNKKQK